MLHHSPAVRTARAMLLLVLCQGGPLAARATTDLTPRPVPSNRLGLRRVSTTQDPGYGFQTVSGPVGWPNGALEALSPTDKHQVGYPVHGC